MKICIWIILFLFHSRISTGKYYQNDFEELLDSFIERSSDDFEAKDDDPNDRVDVKLWNQLNKEDIKNMPKIDDYSDEVTAARWLKWYSRISLRYSQVNIEKIFKKKNSAYIFRLVLI
jgi:hypothetical protein